MHDHSSALAHLTKCDRTLARLIRRVGPCTLKPRKRTPYEALVTAVVYQQLNGTAATTILGRFKALFPGQRFPQAQAVMDTTDERLRSAGLSRAKTAAIKDIAAKTLGRLVPAPRSVHRLSDTELVERLTEVRGVGPWTVEMFLIFTLGRPDVLPATDYGVRKGFAQTYGLKDLPAPKDLLAAGEKWRPHRTVASWYLWRSLELE